MSGDQLYFEDFKIGDRFASPSRTLSDAHFLFFSAFTGDNHPIHYDDEYARRTKFGSRVAHGLLLMGMTALGASGLSPRLEASLIAFVEQGCRFVRPAFVGDTIYPSFSVEKLEAKQGSGLLRLKVELKNQRGEALLEGHQVYLLRSRPVS
jgi:3-hydroxybutyryl-CoA dehydratase